SADREATSTRREARHLKPATREQTRAEVAAGIRDRYPVRSSRRFDSVLEFDVEHRRRTAVRKKHTSADHGFCRRADRTFCFASDERYADAGRSREIVEADGPFFTALESTIEEASFAVGDERSAVVPKRDVRGWLSICENQASDDREPFLEHEVRFDVARRRVEGEYRSETLPVSSHPGDEPN